VYLRAAIDTAGAIARVRVRFRHASPQNTVCRIGALRPRRRSMVKIRGILARMVFGAWPVSRRRARFSCAEARNLSLEF
jgi:hypothetical protein